MCVPGLAAYLRAAETRRSDTELIPTEPTDTALTQTALTTTRPSEEPRPALVSASGTTATEGRA